MVRDNQRYETWVEKTKIKAGFYKSLQLGPKKGLHLITFAYIFGEENGISLWQP